MSRPAPRRPYETGLARARRRRQRRAVLVISLVSLLVVGGFVAAIAYYQRWLPGQQAAAQPTCPTTFASPAHPEGRFTLNIYNSARSEGRANELAIAMRSRHFDIGAVANDPYLKRIGGEGEIRFGPAGKAAAEQYVRTLVPGAAMTPDGRTDTSVDIAIGDDFTMVSRGPEDPTPTAAPGC